MEESVTMATEVSPATRSFSRAAWAKGVDTLSLSSVVAFFAIWYGVCAINENLVRLFNPILFPSPLTIVQTGVEMTRSGELLQDIAASMARVVQGFVIAAVAGVGVGLLVGRVRLIERLVDPLVQMLRPIPPLAFLPMMVLWFGIGESSKVAFIAYATFFPIFTTTVDGIKFIDPVLLRAASSLGATRRDLFRYVVLPAAMPSIITGLRIGFGLAFFVIVAAEFIAADSGLGFLINDSRTFFQVPRMLLGAAVIGIIGFAFNVALRSLEARLLRWRVDSRG
jgi:ABC-type nitrate/sulfonate/bicarbonate transport system permease component